MTDKPIQIYDDSMVEEHVFIIKGQSVVERRSGVERRVFSYSWHIPERRSGTDKRRQAKRAY